MKRTLPRANRLGSSKVTDAMRLSYALWFTMAFLVAIWSVYILNDLLNLGGESTGCIPAPWKVCVGF